MSIGNDGDFALGERRRRSWTRDEKRRIVDESLRDGASIAEVARRHELNANLLFTWRRKMGLEPPAPNEPMPILPVTISSESVVEERCCPSVGGQMEIVLSGDDRIIVWADVETPALTRVLKALSRR